MDVAAKPSPALALIAELDAIRALLPNLLDLDAQGDELGFEVVAAHYKLFAAKSWRFFSAPEREAGFGGRMAHGVAARNSRKTLQTMAMYEETFQRLRNGTPPATLPDGEPIERAARLFRDYCVSTDAYFRDALGQSARAAA